MSTPYMTTALPIRMMDIPEEYRDIAEAIGLEAFTQLTLLCGGQSLCIPKRESLERGAEPSSAVLPGKKTSIVRSELSALAGSE